MAYREFHFEKTYASPDVGILERGLVGAAEKSAEAIGNIFKSAAEAKKAKQLAADQYKVDFTAKKFENDDKLLFAQGVAVTEKGKNEIRTTGRISPETENYQNMSLMNKQQSEFQWKEREKNLADIKARAAEDKYFNPEFEYQNVDIADYGRPGSGEVVDYTNRGARQEAYKQIKFTDPRSLYGKVYTSDYVKLFGKKEQAKASADPNYKSSSSSSAPFRNAQGAIEVTTQHAKEYLNSRPDGSVARWIENQVEEEMDADVRYMKQREPEVFAGMSDDAIKLYLKANPEDNLYNQKDFATRVIDKAKYELGEAADISKKTDYETKVDKTATGGYFNNDNVGFSHTTHDDAVGTAPTGVTGTVAEAHGINKNTMPGGNLRLAKGKVGQAIPINVNPRTSFNVRTGKNEKGVGTTQFNLTGYQLGVYKKDGTFVPTDDINKIPYSEFKNLEPEMKISLRGYTVNQGNKLGEIASRKSDLEDQLAKAKQEGKADDVEKINLQLLDLGALQNMMNLSKEDVSDEDLMSAYKVNGISVTSIQKDVILRAAQADIDLIDKNITQGLNLNDKAKWSDEMLSADAQYKKRAAEAEAAGYKDKPLGHEEFKPFPEEFKKAVKKPAAKPAAPTVQIAKPTSQAEYDALKKGDKYYDENGKVRTKQ